MKPLKLLFGRLLLWWWRLGAPRCHCGRPLHYRNPGIRQIVEHEIRLHGPLVRVNVNDRVWLVPRHYIALHGLRADQIGRLGFQEVTDLQSSKIPADKALPATGQTPGLERTGASPGTLGGPGGAR